MIERLKYNRPIWLMALCTTLSLGAAAQTTVAEHWSPYDYPREIPEGVNYHIIEDGDTLWDISARYLGDPLLWPSLYQANDYITDPDLIYPGDPILLDIGVAVTPDAIADNLGDDVGDPVASGEDSLAFGEGAAGEDFGDFTEMGDASETEGGDELMSGEPEDMDVSSITSFDSDASEFVILPAGTRSDMECSTYLYDTKSPKDVLPFELKIASGENGKSLSRYASGDVVFLNKGSAFGVQTGDEYAVRRVLRPVNYPGYGGEFIGMAIDQVGILKVIAVQEKNATALIIDSCSDLKIGDFVVPYESEPIPLITELPNLARWEAFSTDGAGMIVYAEDDVISLAKGYRANIDLGIENNVAPGDLFVVYRPNPHNNEKEGLELPNMMLGYAVALRTDATTTVIKLIDSFSEITVGDLVAPLAFDSFGSFDEGE